MDDSPLPSILIFVVCLIGSTLCSAAETAFASVGRAKIMSLSDDGDKRADRVLTVLDMFDDTLSANLICNNIFNNSCATAATAIAIGIGGAGSVTVSTILTTVIVFFTAEMLPKKFAKACPEIVAAALAPAIIFIVRVLKPLTVLLTKTTSVITHLLFGKSQAEVTYTANEVETLIDTVAEDKALSPEHGSLIKSAYDITALPVASIETSWKNTTKLPSDADYDTIISIARSVQHTRFPVVENGKPIGVLHIRMYLKARVTNGKADIKSIMTEPLFISEYTPADHALSEMSKHKTSIAFVTRDGGEVSGIVTVEDILESLVGKMDDETDTEDNV